MIDNFEKTGAFSVENWKTRAQRYGELEWVKESRPIEETLSRLNLRGDEFVVDVGTGTQAVLRAFEAVLCRGGKVVGFDLSFAMLKAGQDWKSSNSKLLVADAISIPLCDRTADIAIARQVIHHIRVPEDALKEMVRVVRPGGRVVVAEHVVKNENVMAFERKLFGIKEPGRHLWLPYQLASLVEGTGSFSKVDCFTSYIPNYPMLRGWLEKSGLSEEVQGVALACLKNAPSEVKEELNIQVVQDEDEVTMDGYYACVIAEK